MGLSEFPKDLWYRTVSSYYSSMGRDDNLANWSSHWSGRSGPGTSRFGICMSMAAIFPHGRTLISSLRTSGSSSVMSSCRTHGDSAKKGMARRSSQTCLDKVGDGCANSLAKKPLIASSMMEVEDIYRQKCCFLYFARAIRNVLPHLTSPGQRVTTQHRTEFKTSLHFLLFTFKAQHLPCDFSPL